MWVTKCVFLHLLTLHHVNLGKSQISWPDIRYTKVSTKWVKKVFKLDDNFFHHMQPKCNINSCEMKRKKENSKNVRKNTDGTDLRRLPLSVSTLEVKARDMTSISLG